MTVIGRHLATFSDLVSPGGFLLEEGGDVAIQYCHKPKQRLIENYRLMLGWIWIDAPDGIEVYETSKD